MNETDEMTVKVKPTSPSSPRLPPVRLGVVVSTTWLTAILCLGGMACTGERTPDEAADAVTDQAVDLPVEPTEDSGLSDEPDAVEDSGVADTGVDVESEPDVESDPDVGPPPSRHSIVWLGGGGGGLTSTSNYELRLNVGPTVPAGAVATDRYRIVLGPLAHHP